MNSTDFCRSATRFLIGENSERIAALISVLINAAISRSAFCLVRSVTLSEDVLSKSIGDEGETVLLSYERV